MADIHPAAAKRKPAVTRRELLNYAWLASLGILTFRLAGISFYVTLPRVREGEFGGVIQIGRVSDLPGANESPANYPEGKFWLVHTRDGLLALHKVCTHLDCLFNWDEQEGKFVCPCHGSQFARDGVYLSGPAPRSLDRFVIQVLSPEGELVAETDSQVGNPLPIAAGEAENTPAGGDTAGSGSRLSSLLPVTEVNAEAIVQVDTGRKIKGQPVVATK
jgi:cytochrome b6-f complex iron-sulfur subunit